MRFPGAGQNLFCAENIQGKVWEKASVQSQGRYGDPTESAFGVHSTSTRGSGRAEVRHSTVHIESFCQAERLMPPPKQRVSGEVGLATATRRLLPYPS